MKAIAVKCGHVTRQLKRKEPLKGKTLEFALSLVSPSGGNVRDEKQLAFYRSIADKLKAGEALDEYQHHILVDVLLLQKRLGAN